MVGHHVSSLGRSLLRHQIHSLDVSGCRLRASDAWHDELGAGGIRSRAAAAAHSGARKYNLTASASDTIVSAELLHVRGLANVSAAPLKSQLVAPGGGDVTGCRLFARDSQMEIHAASAFAIIACCACWDVTIVSSSSKLEMRGLDGSASRGARRDGGCPLRPAC